MIVLPMAGMSRRFTEAGYERPKYMLPFRGKSLFRHVMEGFKGYFGREDILVIYRDIADTRRFLEEEIAAIGLPPGSVQLIELDGPTRGQAETVALGLRKAGVGAQTPLTIFNIDTIRPGFSYPAAFDLAQIDGCLEVFPGEGEHWSFVRPDPDEAEAQRVIEVTEKRRISNLCSTGLYYFRCAGTFLDLFAEIEALDPSTLEGGEFYVAPMYRKLIERGGDVRYDKINPRDVLFSGTPAEYEALLRKTPSTRRNALCISGQLRGPRSRLQEIAELAERLDADIYISSWKKRGRKTLAGAAATGKKARVLGMPAALYLQRGALDDLFPGVEARLSSLPAEDAEPDLRAAFPDAVIEIEDETFDLSFSTEFPDKNSLRMLYKIWRCNRLKQGGEKLRGSKYDLVLRLRPDILPEIGPEQAPSAGSVLMPEFSGDGLNDQFWFCESSADDRLAALFGQAVLAPDRKWNFIHRELRDWADGLGLQVTEAAIPTRLGDGFDPEEQDAARHMIAEAIEAGAFQAGGNLPAEVAALLPGLLRLSPSESALPALEDLPPDRAGPAEIGIGLVALAYHDARALTDAARSELVALALLAATRDHGLSSATDREDLRLRRLERNLRPRLRQAPASSGAPPSRQKRVAEIFAKLRDRLAEICGATFERDLARLAEPVRRST